jgi:hypothetical protein
LYVHEGNFNHFEYKLCQTKPNSETPKFNLSPYMINRYDNNSELLTMQKQSQTKPNYSVFIRVNSWLNSKQTQTKPKFTRHSLGEGGRTQMPLGMAYATNPILPAPWFRVSFTLMGSPCGRFNPNKSLTIVPQYFTYKGLICWLNTTVI